VSSIAASVLFKSMIAFIRTGNFGTGITINQNNAAAKIEAGYSRRTSNGSFGFWRYSDLTNTNCTHFDRVHLTHPSLSTAQIRFGIPGSQSSIEGTNGSLKDEFDFTKRNTIDLLDNFRVGFRHRSMREYED